jgi:UDPglucose 6-dehydrogenase
MGSVKWDMVNPEMIMIGTEDGNPNALAGELRELYDTVMQNDPRYEIGTWDECEAIKIFYNTFISAKVGLVNMIQDFALRIGNINVDVVTDALARSTMRIMGPKYMTAGMGDAGACHPRDNIALRWLAKEYNICNFKFSDFWFFFYTSILGKSYRKKIYPYALFIDWRIGFGFGLFCGSA